MHLSTSTGLLYLGVSIGAAMVISSLHGHPNCKTLEGKIILLAHIILCFLTRVILITIRATLMTIDAMLITYHQHCQHYIEQLQDDPQDYYNNEHDAHPNNQQDLLHDKDNKKRKLECYRHHQHRHQTGKEHHLCIYVKVRI